MTKESSRYIPSEIKRAVLFEAGHACAIPTCQFPAIEFAHIVPYAKVKKQDSSNFRSSNYFVYLADVADNPAFLLHYFTVSSSNSRATTWSGRKYIRRSASTVVSVIRLKP